MARMLTVAGVCLALWTAAAQPADAQVRIWRDNNGAAVRASFEKFTNNRVVLQANGKRMGVPFWDLTPADQKFVKQLLESQGKGADVPEIAAEPRLWTDTAGNKAAAQFLKAEEGGKVVLVVKGTASTFGFEHFCGEDQAYVREQLQQQGLEDLVPAKDTDNALAGTRQPGQNANPGVRPSTRPSTPGFPSMSAHIAEANRQMDEAHRRQREAHKQHVESMRQQLEESRRRTEQSTNRVLSQFDSGGDSTTPGVGNSVPSYPDSSHSGEQMASVSHPAEQAPSGSPFETRSPLRSASERARQASLPGSSYDLPAGAEWVNVCMSCNKEVSSNAKVGQRCPHCGVRWDEEVDERGETVASSPRLTGRGIKGLIFLVIIVIGGLAKVASKVVGSS